MNKSMAKVGGVCSILLGISYIVVGGAFALMPAEQVGGRTKEFMASFPGSPVPFTVMIWTFAVGGLIAFAVVPAVTALVGDPSAEGDPADGWLRSSSGLALLGFGVTAVAFFWMAATTPARVVAYQEGDAATKAAIVATESLINIDMQGWFRFGCTGVWALVIGIVALRKGTLPRALAGLWVFGAVMYFVTLVGEALLIVPVILVGAILGGCIAAPIIYIATGVILLRKSSQADA